MSSKNPFETNEIEEAIRHFDTKCPIEVHDDMSKSGYLKDKIVVDTNRKSDIIGYMEYGDKQIIRRDFFEQIKQPLDISDDDCIFSN